MFFRGLFFLPEQMVALAVVGLFFLIFIVSSRLDLRAIGRTRMELAALLLFGGYLLSTVLAAQLRSALLELLKYGLYLMVFILTSRAVRGPVQRVVALWTILVGMTATGVVGLFSVSGPWHYPGAIFENKLASTFQYHNSFGAVMATGLVLALGLQVATKPQWQRLLLGAMGALFGLCVIYSQSRGTWLISLVVLAALVILTIRAERSLLVARFLAIGVGIVAGMPFFGRGLHQLSYWIWLGWLIAGVLAAAVTYVVEMPTIRRHYGAVATALVIIGIAASVILVSRLPADLVARFKSLSLRDVNVIERFAFDIDSLKMIAASPLLGYGGGGWFAVYKRFQSYGYTTRLGHNNFLQTWVEGGILGFAALIFMWYWFFRALFPRDSTKSATDERAVMTAVAMAGGFLGLHSIIDFDLSLGAISIILWALFGLANGCVLDREVKAGHGRRFGLLPAAGAKRSFPVLPVLVYALAVALAASLFAGDRLQNRALAEYNAGQSPLAMSNMLLAARVDPLNSTALTLAAQMDEQAGKYDIAYALNSRAVKFDRFNSVILTTQSRMAYRLGRGDEAVWAARQAVKMEPQEELRYETLANLYVTLGKYFLSQGNTQQAQSFFQQVPTLGAEMAQRGEQNYFKNSVNALPPDTSAMEMYEGQSLLALRQWKEAETHFQAGIDLGVKQQDRHLIAENYMWLGLALQKERSQADPEAQAALRKAFELQIETVSNYTEALKWVK